VCGGGTSKDYTALARAHGVILSGSRRGGCWDYAVAESFFAAIKREVINDRAWPTGVGLHRAEGWHNTAGSIRRSAISPRRIRVNRRSAVRKAA
jgi:transposase InsO family protein